MSKRGNKLAKEVTLEYEKIWASLKQSDQSSVFHAHYSLYRQHKRVIRGDWKDPELNYGSVYNKWVDSSKLIQIKFDQITIACKFKLFHIL
jgi:hypothetical protein